MNTDLHNEIKVTKEIGPAAAPTANGVTTGTGVAVAGYEALEFLIVSGVITDGSFTPSIEGSDDNFTTPVVIGASGLIGTIAGATFAATDDSVAKKIGVNLQTGTRYAKYRLKLTQAGATSGGFIAAVSVLSRARYAPVS